MNENVNEETMSTREAILTLLMVGGVGGLAFGIMIGCCDIVTDAIKCRIQKRRHKKLLKEYVKEVEDN